jgi:hypothetical protein
LRQHALRSLALAFACSLASFSALSDDCARFATDDDEVVASMPLRPRGDPRALDEGQLDELRAGLLAPTPLQDVGVVLWDEPPSVPTCRLPM